MIIAIINVQIDPTAELTVWNGIVVTPSDSVYDAGLYERKAGDEEEPDQEDEETLEEQESPAMAVKEEESDLVAW